MISQNFSRLIAAILIPSLTDDSKIVHFHASFSPVTPAAFDYKTDTNYIIERAVNSIKIGFLLDETDKISYIPEEIKDDTDNVKQNLQHLTKKIINSLTYSTESAQYKKANTYEFTISLNENDTVKSFKILIDAQFFKLFIPTINTAIVYDNIENFVLPFFHKPDFFHINTELLFSTLTRKELSDLLNHMMKKNILSPYEITLLILSYPETASKIKKSLSDNILRDVSATIKKYSHQNLTRRDLIEGVYSFEESLNMILHDDTFNYSPRMQELSDILKKINLLELYYMKSFDHWIEEIIEKDMFYKTLSKCSDQIIEAAFREYRRGEFYFLRNYISKRRLDEIFANENMIPISKSVDARSKLLQIFRKEYHIKKEYGHESFGYLISKITGKYSFEVLLNSAGWFIISTALKQSPRAIKDKFLSNINPAASMLIEDVLSGSVNPNIIHDEIQVNKARKICVGKILLLHEEGRIELED